MTALEHSIDDSHSSQSHITFFLFYIFSLLLSLLFHKLNYPFIKDQFLQTGLESKPIKSDLKRLQAMIKNEHSSHILSNQSDCSICFEEFQKGESLIYLPGCLHVYHQVCIFQWISEKASCPYCRSDILMSLEAIQQKEIENYNRTRFGRLQRWFRLHFIN